MSQLELVFGTTNRGKIGQVKDVLEPAGIQVIVLSDLGIDMDVIEDGQTVAENARIKAVAYASKIGRPVFSFDNGLYFDELPDHLQPGLNVRRVPNGPPRLSDTQMLEYYLDLIKRYGGSMKGRWDYALAIATPDGRLAETMIITPRQFSTEVCPISIEGYPLESIQIDPDSGRYIAGMSKAERAAFWQKTIGEDLVRFVQENRALLG